MDEDIEMILLSNVDTGTDVDIGIDENRDEYKYRYIHGFLAENLYWSNCSGCVSSECCKLISTLSGSFLRLIIFICP